MPTDRYGVAQVKCHCLTENNNQLLRVQCQLAMWKDFHSFILHWNSDFNDSVTKISAGSYNYFLSLSLYSLIVLQLHFTPCKSQPTFAKSLRSLHLNSADMYLHNVWKEYEMATMEYTKIFPVPCFDMFSVVYKNSFPQWQTHFTEVTAGDTSLHPRD